jgi:hypothetical protein
MNSRFDGLANATRGFSSNPLRHGEYVVRLESCDFFNTEMKGNMWKNTLTILGVIDGDHRVGEEVHTFYREAVGKSTFLGNLKGFLAGITGANDEDVTEADADKALEDGSPVEGLVFIVRGRQRASKNKKDDKTGEPLVYTLYDWNQAMTPEEISEAIGDEAVAKFFPSGL